MNVKVVFLTTTATHVNANARKAATAFQQTLFSDGKATLYVGANVLKPYHVVKINTSIKIPADATASPKPAYLASSRTQQLASVKL